MAEFLTTAEKACFIEMEIRAGRARRPIDMTAVLKVLAKATLAIVVLAAFYIALGVACMEDGYSAQECRGDWSLTSADGV